MQPLKFPGLGHLLNKYLEIYHLLSFISVVKFSIPAFKYVIMDIFHCHNGHICYVSSHLHIFIVQFDIAGYFCGDSECKVKIKNLTVILNNLV